MSAGADCYMCRGTRWISLYGGPSEGSMDAPCLACNPSGSVPHPDAAPPEMGSVQSLPGRRNEAVDPMVWCDCLRDKLPLTAKNADVPCDVCHAEQQAAA